MRRHHAACIHRISANAVRREGSLVERMIVHHHRGRVTLEFARLRLLPLPPQQLEQVPRAEFVQIGRRLRNAFQQEGVQPVVGVWIVAPQRFVHQQRHSNAVRHTRRE